MAGYSARQSSYTTGDTITAAHSNDEFNQVLAAFNATTGHTHDGTAGEGGPVGSIRDADSLNKVLVDSTNNHLEFYVEVSSAAVQQLRIQDGAIVPITDNDIDLGTSSLEFKDLYIDGTANVDAINLDGTLITSTAAELNILDGVTATAAELNIMDGVTSTTAELNILDGVTSTAAELNLVDGITAGTVSASKAVIVDSNKDLTGLRNLTISGDLTVSGDDITMGTNTAGNLLVADGTNFNSIAVGSLSEISTVAGDDVLLAVDTSGGGLKKITRSTLTAGLVSGSEISNVVEDTTPQLGGNLDMNGNDIITTSNADIDLAPNGTGHVTVKGNDNPGTIQFNCEQNSHGVQVKGPAHSAGSSAILTLPTATGNLIGSGDTGTLPLAAIDIDGGTDIGAALADADLFVVDDGAGGTNRKMAASRLQTYIEGKISGDITISSGTAAIGAGVIVNADINSSAAIADSKLAAISTAGKVALSALEIDGGTDIGADLTTSDLIIVDDGAGGTNRKAALSRLTTFMTGQGFSTDDPTALAIALG